MSRTRSNPSPYAWSGYVDVSRAYAVNGLNQYASVGGTAFGYDANGNLVSDGTTSYTYDVENRLVVTSYGGGFTYAYDPLGRLYGFVGSAGKSSVYDGDQRIVDYAADPATIQARYVLGPGSDNPLLWYPGGALTTRYALQADERGSIVSAVDATGALIGTNSYDEYGIPATTNTGRYGYTGQVWIATLGMWYYKARMYSPTLGRFMQTDPIGYADQNNLYAYVANDPVNKTDPTGTYECIGSKSQCGAVEGAYNRAAAALKSDNLSKADRTKLQGALTALGKPGHANGVNVSFASGNAIARATNGRSDIGYTEQGKNCAINVRLNSNFGSLYDSYRGKMFGKDFSRLSARDERSGIFVHEGRHVYQIRNGMTPESYSRDVQRFERDAKDRGKLINKAYGSVSVYDTPED